MNRPSNEFYSNDKMRVTAGSAADIAHIVFFGSNGDRAAQYLLEKPADADNPAVYDFAGRHMGMPRQDIWAITKDGSHIINHLIDVLRDASAAIDVTNKK